MLSEENLLARRGRFTAYNIHDLLSNGRAKGEIGKGFYTLCFEKAVEIVFGRDESWETASLSWDVKRGNALEPEAFDRLKAKISKDFKVVKEGGIFFPYGDNAGSTPDGLVGSTGTIQIKCPRPEKLFRLISGGKSVIDPEYISQMNMEMLSTNSDHSYFYNYAIWQDRVIDHTIIIEPNKETQEKIIERIGLGVIERDKHVEKLRNNMQFDWN